MAHERFLDMPSLRTILTAIGFAIGFLFLAYCLYEWNDWKPRAHWLKVADSLINGAIVTILFATLKAMFDLPKWRQEQAAQKLQEQAACKK